MLLLALGQKLAPHWAKPAFPGHGPWPGSGGHLPCMVPGHPPSSDPASIPCERAQAGGQTV